MQVDILDLDSLDKKFDIIESAGVLHHMDNPCRMEGINRLPQAKRINENWLYSDLARQNIVKIRDEISQLGIGSSEQEMRSFEIKFLNQKKIIISELRILMTLQHELITRSSFHVQEYRFTIPQINEYLDELGLEFCGFESMKLCHILEQ